jgi:hypothetical protein
MEKETQQALAIRLNKALKKRFEQLKGFDYLETTIDIEGLGTKYIQIIPKNHTPVNEYKEEKFEEFLIL